MNNRIHYYSFNDPSNPREFVHDSLEEAFRAGMTREDGGVFIVNMGATGEVDFVRTFLTSECGHFVFEEFEQSVLSWLPCPPENKQESGP